MKLAITDDQPEAHPQFIGRPFNASLHYARRHELIVDFGGHCDDFITLKFSDERRALTALLLIIKGHWNQIGPAMISDYVDQYAPAQVPQ